MLEACASGVGYQVQFTKQNISYKRLNPPRGFNILSIADIKSMDVKTRKLIFDPMHYLKDGVNRLYVFSSKEGREIVHSERSYKRKKKRKKKEQSSF